MDNLKVIKKHILKGADGELQSVKAEVDVLCSNSITHVDVEFHANETDAKPAIWINLKKQPKEYGALRFSQVHAVLCSVAAWLSFEMKCSIWMDDAFKMDGRENIVFLPIAIL